MFLYSQSILCCLLDPGMFFTGFLARSVQELWLIKGLTATIVAIWGRQRLRKIISKVYNYYYNATTPAYAIR